MTRRIGSAVARCVVLALLACLQGQASADTLQVRIPCLAEVPSLDTPLGFAAGAAEVTDFQQREPGDGVPCSRETHAWISYDAANLYVTFDCKDEPGKVRAQLSR